MDERVLEAQVWVNRTYANRTGYKPCGESGTTGWPTMYSLTRALQLELGIMTPSDSFGPLTLAALTSLGEISAGSVRTNIVKIVQYGLFCKGYWGGDTIGRYDGSTGSSVRRMKTHMGLSDPNAAVQPKIFKALLSMDAYVVLAGGTTEIRRIQQWLNQRYFAKSTFFVGPCDGIYSRDVQQALMKGIQYELGIAEDQVTGNFGPSTQAGLRKHRVKSGSTGIWVQLYSAACVFNGVVDDTRTVFKSSWDSALGEWTKAFQTFSQLEVTKVADFPTWAQLLVSTGDPDRPASASDTRFHISVARARALVAAGYMTVGRYLDEDADSTLDKELQPGELADIFAGGMRVFPISQYNGRLLTDFTRQTGIDHATRAHDRAHDVYALNSGTVIYFAVDYDATDEQITSNIIPYFNGVQAGLASRGKRYIAGVYGSRNVCDRVSAEAYARFSFVSGMSYGFSGNLGFPLPANWSYNQIKEIKFTANGETIDLDRVVRRDKGGDPGLGPENVGGTASPLTGYLAFVDSVYAAAVRYNKGSVNRRVLEYLRYPKYVEEYRGWGLIAGDVDYRWIDYADAQGLSRVTQYTDPGLGIQIDVDHFAATANAVLVRGSGNGSTPGGAGEQGWRGDFGGWGGDLSTFFGEWMENSSSYASGYDFCLARLANQNVASSFPLNDMVEDVDGYLIGAQLRRGGRIDNLLRTHLSTAGPTSHLTRFTRFVSQRFGGSRDTLVDAARTMLVDVGADDTLDGLRDLAIYNVAGYLSPLPEDLSSDRLDPFLEGFAEVALRLKDST